MPKIKRSMPVGTVKRILMEKGVKKISDKAAVQLSEFLEDLIGKIGREAQELANHSKRTTVKDRDIKFVLKRLEKLI